MWSYIALDWSEILGDCTSLSKVKEVLKIVGSDIFQNSIHVYKLFEQLSWWNPWIQNVFHHNVQREIVN